MHNRLYLLVLVLVIGCREKPNLNPIPESKQQKIILPKNKAVHNSCANVWAVRVYRVVTSGFVFDGHGKMDTIGIDSGYWGQHMGGWISDEKGGLMQQKVDSADYANLGEEYQYHDSVTAIMVYNGFNRRIFVADSLEKDKAYRDQRIKDSIFKCQHSYN